LKSFSDKEGAFNDETTSLKQQIKDLGDVVDGLKN
jgi:hypothetical protein